MTNGHSLSDLIQTIWLAKKTNSFISSSEFDRFSVDLGCASSVKSIGCIFGGSAAKRLIGSVPGLYFVLIFHTVF